MKYLDYHLLPEELKEGTRLLFSESSFRRTRLWDAKREHEEERYLLRAVLGDALLVDIHQQEAVIHYTRKSEFFRGLGIVIADDGNELHIEERCSFSDYGYMADLSRNGVMTVEAIKRLIRMLALMGYTSLQLYTEDTYEMKGEPYFGYLRGGLKGEGLKELDAYGAVFGIELVPCIQTLAHLNAIFRWRKYYGVCEGYDVLMPGEEGTYALLDKMFASLRECFRTDRVNIGMDEAASLGRCAYWDKNGPQEDRMKLFVEHLNQVNEIAARYRFTRLMMWGDMFFYNGEEDEEVRIGGKPVREEIRRMVPPNITLIDWCYDCPDYLEDVMKSYRTFGRELCYAGMAYRLHSLAPQNGRSIRYLKTQMDACKRNQIERFLLTAWGDRGSECSFFSVLPAMFSSAEYAYGNETASVRKRFEILFGCSYDDIMKLDYAGQRFAGEDVSLYHKQAAELMEAKERAGEWAYLFEPQILLCKIRAHRQLLYEKTRQACLSRDFDRLKELLEQDYGPLEQLLSQLLEALWEQWRRESRPHGFDVIELRMGGVLLCVREMIRALEAFAWGRTDIAPQMEGTFWSLLRGPGPDGEAGGAEFAKLYSAYTL